MLTNSKYNTLNAPSIITVLSYGIIQTAEAASQGRQGRQGGYHR